MNKYSGSNFDDFLAEEGLLEEVSARAQKRLLALQIEDIMGHIQTFTKSKNREEVMMPRAFVVKALDDGWPIPGVFEELRAGRARIGWSSRDDQDLRLIQEKVDRGEAAE